MADTFTCAMCGGTFDRGWSDEEAAAERAANWPGIPEEACAVVCDDCYNGMAGAAGAAGVAVRQIQAAIADKLREAGISVRIYGPESMTAPVPEEIVLAPDELGIFSRIVELDDVRRVVISCPPQGGDVPGIYDLVEFPRVRTERPAPDYLRHDPTKSTRRRRR